MLVQTRGNTKNTTRVNFYWCSMIVSVLLSHVCALFTHADPTSEVHAQISGQTGANCSHLLLPYRALLPSSRNSSLKGIDITQHDWRTIDLLGLKHFLLLSLVKSKIKVFFCKAFDIVQQIP